MMPYPIEVAVLLKIHSQKTIKKLQLTIKATVWKMIVLTVPMEKFIGGNC